MSASKEQQAQHEELVAKIVEAYERHAGSVRATAAELDVTRSTVRKALRDAGKYKNKPLAGGKVRGTKEVTAELPKAGKVKRYLLTSAQNNTRVHEKMWQNLLALADHYSAKIMVGTFSYNQNAYGELAVKRGKAKPKEDKLWYDDALKEYFSDERVNLGAGLVWCGEYNALPTASNPLAGLEPYAARKSAIFPHAKMAMRSIPTMIDAPTKLIYTTGCVTKMNYIQKRAGTIAEHHHVYGALIVEVNDEGHWWVRQLNAESTSGKIQDLDVIVDDGVVTTGNKVEAINWGDLHATFADEAVVEESLDMLDVLQPRFQFLHDVLEGSAISHHSKDNPHVKFMTWLRGLHKVAEEFKRTSALMDRYDRATTKAVVVESNHDNPWIQRWLRDYDYRKDPANAEFYLKAQSYMYAELAKGKMPRNINMLEWCLKEVGLKSTPKFLVADESFLICGSKIECGMHGHLGPGGSRGTPSNLSKMGRRTNIGHTHQAGIYDGLYMAGTSTKLKWEYNKGPSNWSHSHIVTYPNGKRAIVTIYAGKWRA